MCCFAAFPEEENEVLGILVPEDCKVGITFTQCLRNGGMFLADSLQVSSNAKLTFWSSSIKWYMCCAVSYWGLIVEVDCWGLILCFFTYMAARICLHQGKRTILVLFPPVPKLLLVLEMVSLAWWWDRVGQNDNICSLAKPVVWKDLFSWSCMYSCMLGLIVNHFPSYCSGSQLLKLQTGFFPMTSKKFSIKVIRDICLWLPVLRQLF